MLDNDSIKCAVVIPCYKVSNNILNVIDSIGNEVKKIFIIDDNCPENSGKLVKLKSSDKRLKILYNSNNIGVGGSTKRGFYEAFKDDDINVCVKIDGDGQMDTQNIKKFLEPFKKNKYLYVKGNRFHIHRNFLKMPIARIFGNFFLSLTSKITTGQYNVFDVNNGFIALHKNVYKNLNLKNIDDDFFFETSMVAEMRNIKCKIIDLKIDTIYKNEKSNLVIKKIFFKFILKHIAILIKRLFNEYIKNKNYYMIVVILGIFLTSIYSITIIKKIGLLIVLFFLFFYIDKKQLHN